MAPDPLVLGNGWEIAGQVVLLRLHLSFHVSNNIDCMRVIYWIKYISRTKVTSLSGAGVV